MKPSPAIPHIGIIGAGHLGLTLAEVLLQTGVPKQNLSISYGGSAETLAGNIAPTQTLLATPGITFLLIRPQSFHELAIGPAAPGVCVVSGMAGISLHRIKNKLGNNACRIITSGPATIRSGKGLVAIYPENQPVAGLLSAAGFTTYTLARQHQLHHFTVGVCLPAALVLADRLKLPVAQGIAAYSKRFPLFTEIARWAAEVLPSFGTPADADAYVHKMATPGGITEAIITHLQTHRRLYPALQAGYRRSLQLATE